MYASIETLRELSVALGNSHDFIIEVTRNMPEAYRSEGKVLCETLRDFKHRVDGDLRSVKNELPLGSE